MRWYGFGSVPGLWRFIVLVWVGLGVRVRVGIVVSVTLRLWRTSGMLFLSVLRIESCGLAVLLALMVLTYGSSCLLLIRAS